MSSQTTYRTRNTHTHAHTICICLADRICLFFVVCDELSARNECLSFFFPRERTLYRLRYFGTRLRNENNMSCKVDRSPDLAWALECYTFSTLSFRSLSEDVFIVITKMYWFTVDDIPPDFHDSDGKLLIFTRRSIAVPLVFKNRWDLSFAWPIKSKRLSSNHVQWPKWLCTCINVINSSVWILLVFGHVCRSVSRAELYAQVIACARRVTYSENAYLKRTTVRKPIRWSRLELYVQRNVWAEADPWGEWQELTPGVKFYRA